MSEFHRAFTAESRDRKVVDSLGDPDLLRMPEAIDLPQFSFQIPFIRNIIQNFMTHLRGLVREILGKRDTWALPTNQIAPSFSIGTIYFHEFGPLADSGNLVTNSLQTSIIDQLMFLGMVNEPHLGASMV